MGLLCCFLPGSPSLDASQAPLPSEATSNDAHGIEQAQQPEPCVNKPPDQPRSKEEQWQVRRRGAPRGGKMALGGTQTLTPGHAALVLQAFYTELCLVHGHWLDRLAALTELLAKAVGGASLVTWVVAHTSHCLCKRLAPTASKPSITNMHLLE